jgi:hypothetical protein
MTQGISKRFSRSNIIVIYTAEEGLDLQQNTLKINVQIHFYMLPTKLVASKPLTFDWSTWEGSSVDHNNQYIWSRQVETTTKYGINIMFKRGLKMVFKQFMFQNILVNDFTGPELGARWFLPASPWSGSAWFLISDLVSDFTGPELGARGFLPASPWSGSAWFLISDLVSDFTGPELGARGFLPASPEVRFSVVSEQEGGFQRSTYILLIHTVHAYNALNILDKYSGL